MKWRYGIIKYRLKDNPEHVYYSIGELYFKDDPLKPYACSQEPIEAYVEHDNWVEDNQPIKDITDQLKMMLKDCEKYPIFDSDGPFEPYPYKNDKDN